MTSSDSRHGQPAVIVGYDQAWPALFDREKERLGAVELIRSVEHVGSTAVPGLAAKPIVDVMAGLDRFEDGEACLEQLVELGWEYRPEDTISERWYFQKYQGDTRTHQLHLVVLGGEFWRRHLLFRDYLREHPEPALEYERLKCRLAEQFRNDRLAYTDAKSDFIPMSKHARWWLTKRDGSRSPE